MLAIRCVKRNWLVLLGLVCFILSVFAFWTIRSLARRDIPPFRRGPYVQSVVWREVDENRPHAEIEAFRITLQPSRASFLLPSEVNERPSNFASNVHLAHDDLDLVAAGAKEWDTVYASVCNSALPFNRCAVHFGEEGWGINSSRWNDMQIRVYHLQGSSSVIEEDIVNRVEADVVRMTARSPIVKRTVRNEWRRVSFEFHVWFHDYGGTVWVDFYLKDIGKEVFVFVFMRAGYPKDVTIEEILSSFQIRKEAAVR